MGRLAALYGYLLSALAVAGCAVLFGMMLVICADVLPPHGLLLMTMKGVAPPEVSMAHIFRAVIPFLAISIAVLMLVFLVPAVASWLPSLVG